MPLLVCPNCNVGMTNIQRSGIEIDVCPQCRGVWLDRGELEKLLQPLREEAAAPGQGGFASGASGWGRAASPPPVQDHRGYGHDRKHERQHGHEYEHGHHRGYKQKGALHSLLDIFD